MKTTSMTSMIEADAVKLIATSVFLLPGTNG
jgi:hypothetical protein